MSEAKDKVTSLAEKIDRLRAQAEAKRAEGPAQAQANCLVALLILRSFDLENVLVAVLKAAEWEPITPQRAVEEAEAANSLQASMERYSASLSGRQQPIFSRAEFSRAWEAQTGTTGDVIDPYFAGLVTSVLPLAESIIKRAEELLAEADALTAA